MHLENKDLLKSKAYVNGQWVNGLNGATFNVLNPYDQSVITTIPDMGADDARQVVGHAEAATLSWKSKTAHERAEILKKWYLLINQNTTDLATILTCEQGKPISEARGEIKYGASFIEWFAEEAKRIYGDVIPGHGRDKRILTLKQPVGIVVAITPWNFPVAMVTRKLGPALAAGCVVILKPAEATPLSALALAHLAEQAGFPPGVINVITTNQPQVVGDVLLTDPRVKKLSFTGSTIIGKELLKKCADTVKKVSLELGGNAPFIVFNDADVKAAVGGAIASKYRNAGQTCICANRIYVQSGIFETFLEQFELEVSKLRLGNGMNEKNQIGPMINEKAVQKVDRLISNATKNGARLIAGGSRVSADSTFFQPTILTDVNAEMDIHNEEIFGPIAPVYEFYSEEEVIQLANNTSYGLAAYFYGKDINRIWRISEALEYGMVGINTGMISTAMAPFGGVKESGIGREGGKYGIEEYLEIKYLCFGGVE